MVTSCVERSTVKESPLTMEAKPRECGHLTVRVSSCDGRRHIISSVAIIVRLVSYRF